MATDQALSEQAVKKATNIVRDARLAIVVAIIPLLGLVFILRVVQWYQLKRQCPWLISKGHGEHSELRRDFRAASFRLWFAVLFWPALFLFITVYPYFSRR